MTTGGWGGGRVDGLFWSRLQQTLCTIMHFVLHCLVLIFLHAEILLRFPAFGVDLFVLFLFGLVLFLLL